jgi:hypothetical protein
MNIAKSFTDKFLPPITKDLDSIAIPSFTSQFYRCSSEINTSSTIQKKRKHRTAPVFSPIDRYNSVFWKTYIVPAKDGNTSIENSIYNEDSRLGKKFRRRFRVPYGIFIQMCSSMKEEGFYVNGYCRTCWPKVELELLILGCLRIIGSGSAFDLIQELTCVSESTHNSSFHNKFLKWGTGLANTLIYLPRISSRI